MLAAGREIGAAPVDHLVIDRTHPGCDRRGKPTGVIIMPCRYDPTILTRLESAAGTRNLSVTDAIADVTGTAVTGSWLVAGGGAERSTS